MARTYSEMVSLGTAAPAFDLPIANPDVDDFAKETRSLDDDRPGQEPTTTDLRDALEELLETGEVTGEQVPSMGCSIKWKQTA